jgi:hypothetical protein
MAAATAAKTTTTTLKATLNGDGSLSYEMPKRKSDELLRAYKTCRSCAHFPALQEHADAAGKALAWLLLDLGVETE